MSESGIPQGKLSLSDAVADYGERFYRRSIPHMERQPHLQLMAEVCNLKVPAIMRWVRNGQTATGDAHIRLLCFLEAVGYEIEGTNEIPPPARQLGRLVTFGVVKTFIDVQRAIGYASLQELYRLILRGKGITAEKHRRMTELLRTESSKLPLRQHEVWESKMRKVLAIEPRFVTLAEEDLPLQTPALANNAARSKTVTPSSQPDSRPKPAPPVQHRQTPVPSIQAPERPSVDSTPERKEIISETTPVSTLVQPKPRKVLPSEEVIVPSSALVDAVIASLRHTTELTRMVNESDEPDALARLIRKTLNAGELSQFIDLLKELKSQAELIE